MEYPNFYGHQRESIVMIKIQKPYVVPEGRLYNVSNSILALDLK